MLKILSWNVNGFRAVVKKGFFEFLKKEKPDILGLQEIKQIEKPMIEEYLVVWNPAKRKGYAGTAVYTLVNPLKITKGIGIKKFDDEGRVITLEFEKFFLINAYFPNAQRGLKRLDFKLEFNNALLNYMEKLREKKPIVLIGDFNVAHKEIDIARPKDNIHNAGFTIEERQWMDKLLSKGYIDTFRMFHPNEKGAYSWWTYRFNARARNIGWRVDYVIVSNELKDKVKDAFILKDVYGSDHAPVGILLDV